ncbi:SRPBCC family protein [Streptomyces lancefieldiae]|uniref:SRPBCC family protein n=1 Tax=Streptomyces lancefieldiae TaxID=3075520 RepID=A0ABU3AXN6_9ACTN|nr:SRPBCC family protein [Streptomyces sp. DSM 40712]MDT0614948.1 SRPBCC family protein [Streptomyces sp. DSM 40712]
MNHTRQEGGEPSPLGDLKDALGGYLSATGHSLVGKAGERIGGLTDRLTSSAGGRSSQGGGAGGGARGGSIKATHIMETVDIGVPLRTVYDQWTRLQDFSGFTKGVRSVSPDDEVTSDWIVKVGPSSRGWKATVQEQVPDERIVWTSEGAKGSTRGAVTFHELAPRLTRVVVVVEYYPSGFFEKTGNLWRAQGRRLRLDVKHFARHVTLMGDEEVEGWRGEIRDGEVVRTHEEALEEENADRGEYEDDGEGEGDEESVGYGRDQDEYDEDEDGEYDEEGDEGEDGDEDDEAYQDDERARPYR